MICPKCNKEMFEGYIPTQGIEWFPHYFSRPALFVRKGPKEKQGFRVGKLHQLVLRRQPAWFCKECDIILIDCKSENYPFE